MQRRVQHALCLLIWPLVLLVWAPFAWAESIAFDGLIEPNVIVDIGAPAEGIVATVPVDRSSPIEKGEILVELESSVERLALEKASAAAKLEGDIDLQRVQLAFAKRTYDRLRTIAAVSTHDKDRALTDIALSEFRLKKTQENRAIARLEHKKAKALLARRIIKSPISGVVLERYVSPGEYVNTQPLLRVAQIDPLRVEVIIPAQYMGRITPGMTAVIQPELAIYGDHSATVTLVDQVIDAASSTFGVRLELPNTESQLPSGLRCKVHFHLELRTDVDAGTATLNKASVRIAPEQALQ